MNGSQRIDSAFLERCAAAWACDGAGHRVADVLATTSLHDIALDHRAVARLPFTFSVDIGIDGVTDQGQSLRCWAFAFLNLARRNAARNLNLGERNFELSQCFTYFYDQLEKSSRFLDRILRLIDRPLDDRRLSAALREPITDYGLLSFLMLAKKYGVVPKSVMPDTYCLPDTRPVTRTLSMKLRWCARELRRMHVNGWDVESLEAACRDMLSDIYRMLCRFLGEPPKSFIYEYRDKAGAFHRLGVLSPQEFFSAYCGIDPDDYVEVSYIPGEKTPFGELFYRSEYPDEARPADARVRLNLSIDSIKEAAINQLKKGEQVVFGSDVGKFSSKSHGYMAADLFHYEELFGTLLMLRTPDSRDYHWTVGTHIMCLNGVNLLDDGTPERWKVQNSYGAGMGIDGHYVMDDSWFEPYVVSAVLRRDCLPGYVLPWLEKEPRPL